VLRRSQQTSIAQTRLHAGTAARGTRRGGSRCWPATRGSAGRAVGSVLTSGRPTRITSALWWSAPTCAGMDAAGMTWTAGSACVPRATAARRTPMNVDFLGSGHRERGSYN